MLIHTVSAHCMMMFSSAASRVHLHKTCRQRWKSTAVMDITASGDCNSHA